ncbi:tubulin epsilon and delta complex protein 2 isoform X2 [Tamandua tetradactyla]|uniref:tubulin epsilon and delta complex protein 2 isoform X2 n=1 Tax=Tamandua tetradactyla TaxID=48850 RepID=UPI004053E281
MLPGGCSRRLVAELQGALDACAERQRQLERSLRVCRRLLRAWEPAATPAAEPSPGPETKEEDLSPACTPSPQDLKELELLTQALEKAVQIRKSISKAGEGNKAPVPKSGSNVTPATTAPPPLRAPSRAGKHASETRSPRGICQTKVPTKGHPKHRPLSSGDRISLERGVRATRPGPGLRDQQMAPPAAQQTPEAFTLKEKGTLLQLPVVFRKAASQNCRLWAQINSTQTSDSADTTATATAKAKAQFLQKMQATSGLHSPELSAAQVEAELGRLQEACSLLRLRMQEEVAAAPTDWKQELRCLLMLEGLQALVGQCLHRLQELRAGEVTAGVGALASLPCTLRKGEPQGAGLQHVLPHEATSVLTAVVEQQLGQWPVRTPPGAPSPCGGEADPPWGPRLLLYSSTQELQTLAALRLRVGMLAQQIHLEKVLMAELLPLVSTQGRRSPPGLPLCRAVHSLLCDAGERFPTILRDEPTG